jgi:hypothetical protein
MNKKIERWRGLVPDEDLATYDKGAFGNAIGMGARAALLNIDTTWMFVDPQYAMCGREDPALKAALVRLPNYRPFNYAYVQLLQRAGRHQEAFDVRLLEGRAVEKPFHGWP